MRLQAVRTLASGAVLFALLAAGCAPSNQEIAPAGDPAPAAAPPQTAAASPGQEVFNQKCQGCHGNGGAGIEGSGPSLLHAGHEPEESLRATIENGGGKMPAFKEKLSEQEIVDVIRYIRSIHPPH